MRSLAAIDGWPVGGAAAGVLRRGPVGGPGDGAAASLVGVHGDADRVYAWASVTKLVTALAVLVATEEGVLSLDEPAGPPGATVAHLLAHASGLPLDGRAPLAAPGVRRVYSNTGYELLAEAVADRAGMPFADYLAQGVLEPLGMSRTALAPGSSPAWGLAGPLADLLALGSELLCPRLLHPSTLARATSVAFPGLVGVLPGFGRQDPCDWGLGPEIRDGKHPHWTGSRCSTATFGHFGRSGAFVWVDPVAGISCAATCDRPFGPWAAAAWPALSDAVLGEVEPGG